MYCLLIEISSYRQLKRLKPDLILSLETKINSILELDSAERLNTELGSNIICFESYHAGEGVEIIDKAFEVFDLFKKQNKELMGFTFLLELLNDNNRDAIRHKLKNWNLRVFRDEAFWLGKTATISLSPFYQLQKEGDFWEIVSRNRQSEIKLGDIREFSWREESSERILDELTPYINGEQEPGILFIHGANLSGNDYCLEAALEKLEGEEGTSNWLNVRLIDTDSSAEEAFINAIRPTDLNEISNYLTLSEKRIWDEKEELLKAMIDRRRNGWNLRLSHHDFFSSYALFLSAFIRKKQDQLVPAIMVFHRIDKYNQKSIEIVHDILEIHLPTEAFLPICVSHRPYLQAALRYFPYRKVKVYALSSEEVSERINKYGKNDKLPGADPDLIRRITRGRVETLFHLCMAKKSTDLISRLKASDHIEDSGLYEITWEAVSSLPEESLEILFAAGLVSGILGLKELRTILTSIGLDGIRVSEIVHELYNLGLLEDEKRLVFRYQWLQSKLQSTSAARFKLIQETLVSALYAEWQEGRRTVDIPTFDFFRKHACFEIALEAFHSLLTLLLDRGDLDAAYRLTHSDIPFVSDSLSEQEREYLKSVLYAARLRLGIISMDRSGAEAVFKHWEKSKLSDMDFFHADCTLQRARYFYALQELDHAGPETKKAIISFQDKDDKVGIARAYTDLGTIMMAMENLSDAREYFVIASKTLPQDYIGFEYVRSIYMESLTAFCYGNFSRTLSLLEKIDDSIDILQLSEYRLHAELVKGRILFEFGRYQEALNHFSSCLNHSLIKKHEKSAELFRRWLGRSMAYRGSYKEAVSILSVLDESKEGLFFLSEAFSLSSRYSEALACIEQAELKEGGAPHECIDHVQWDDGFSFAENLSLGRDDEERVLDHLITSQKGIIYKELERTEESVELLRNLTRSSSLSKYDPYICRYYYIYSVLIPENRHEEMDDRLTLLGRAVKQLRERSSRLEESSHKTAFLYKNWWNNLLVEEARKHNLL